MPKNETIASDRPPFVVQILTILGYTGFAIPVSIVAMSEFGVLGLALAAFLAWNWISVANFGRQPSVNEIVEKLRPHVNETSGATGNTSFDNYKAELLVRLEEEQSNFENFLTRLRDAKDKTEFDTFMADREEAARERAASDPA